MLLKGMYDKVCNLSKAPKQAYKRCNNDKKGNLV